MTEKELNKILDDHQKWLKGEGGARADLTYADLSYATLREANLTGAKLREAKLREANLSCAKLREANLTEANLSYADLTEANLSYADLTGANLRSADLKGANLKGADLDYSCMPLWCGDLKAHYDEKQIIQQLFHVLSHVKYSKNSTDRLKEVLLKDEIIDLANEFHRAEECGKITK